MTATAAARLGYRVHVFTPEPDSPCAQVAATTTVAPYEDMAALAGFAAAIDVVTLEFENVPLATARFLAARRRFHPSPDVLAVTQVRSAEKALVNRLGFRTAPWEAVSDAASLEAAVASIGCPAILKTDRMGYDGKGQVPIGAAADAPEAWASLDRVPAVLEGLVRFDCEVSVVLGRGRDGRIAAYPPAENRHRQGILSETIVPAPLAADRAAEAVRIAGEIAAALDYVGVMAVEMFVAEDGALLVNELAPRPHNSGHWTIEGCATSQFEQHVRAICGLPLGATEPHADARMINLIGDDVLAWAEFLADPTAHLHIYGKDEVRPGRKMGHVVWLGRRPG
jgi:5-(carboxyamino)imidazole ribonucleotide synthase